VIVHQPVKDRRFLVHGKVADLDHEHDARERIRAKFNASLLEITDAVGKTVIRDLRVMEGDAAVRLKNLEAEFEVRKHCFVSMLPVNEAEIDLLIDPRRSKRSRIAVDSRDLVDLVSRHRSKLLEHPLGGVVQIGVIESSCVRLLERASVDRVNA